MRRHARAVTYTWTWGEHPTPWGPAPTATAQTVLTVAYYPAVHQYAASLHRQDVFVSDAEPDVWRDVPGTTVIATEPGDRFSAVRMVSLARTILNGLEHDPTWFTGPRQVQDQLDLTVARA